MILNSQQKAQLLKFYPDLAGFLEQKETNDVIKTFIQSIPMVKGEKGDKGDAGYSPIKGKDYFTDEEVHALAQAIKSGLREEVTPIKGVHYFDGEKGDKGDKGDRGIPGIDGIDGIDGKDGKDGKDGIIDENILTPIVEKKVLDGMALVDGRIKLIDQRWKGAGLSKVSHDTTMTGSGTPSDPLIVVGGGGGSPASPSGSLQYNNAGTFGGSANATLDGSGNITANTFVKTGGTSSQYLKADGSAETGIVEADLALTNITTANASTTKHGFLPILPNNAGQFLNGQGNFTIPSGTANSFTVQAFTSQTSINVVHNFGVYPIVQVINNTGAVVIPLSIVNNTLNDFTVTFSASTTGNIIASVGSPQPQAYISVSGTYAILSSDYTVNCSVNTFAVTLPTAVGSTGRIYYIKNSGSGIITINTTSSQTVDAQASGYWQLPQYSSMQVQSTGSNWIIL